MKSAFGVEHGISKSLADGVRMGRMLKGKKMIVRASRNLKDINADKSTMVGVHLGQHSGKYITGAGAASVATGVGVNQKRKAEDATRAKVQQVVGQ